MREKWQAEVLWEGLLPSLGGPGGLFGSHMLEPQCKKRCRGSQVKKGERSSEAEGEEHGTVIF